MKDLRLTIDIRVENDEFADRLIDGDVDSYELEQNINAGEVSIDGIQWPVEDHTS